MEGKKRVIIENVQPVVDGGRYAARRAVGMQVAERHDTGSRDRA